MKQIIVLLLTLSGCLFSASVNTPIINSQSTNLADSPISKNASLNDIVLDTASLTDSRMKADCQRISVTTYQTRIPDGNHIITLLYSNYRQLDDIHGDIYIYSAPFANDENPLETENRMYHIVFEFHTPTAGKASIHLGDSPVIHVPFVLEKVTIN